MQMDKSDLKIVFMGTPSFGLPSLKMLMEEGFFVRAVFSQPDRKAGRGHRMLPTPVKLLAQELDLPVYQFDKIRMPQGVEALKDLAPDLLITAAYGQILTQEILDIPKLGCINVHASLLPKYRGAAPIQWAVINGEKKTGVTTMMTALALDAGDILERDEFLIPNDMTAGELYDSLSGLGANTLRRTLEKLLVGTLERTPQNEDEATYFPMFKKGFGAIDFNQDCEKIRNFVRGTNPQPGAYILYDCHKIKVFRVECEKTDKFYKPGEVLAANAKSGLVVAAQNGAVVIRELQWPGKCKTSDRDFLCGRSIPVGTVFGSPL